MTYREQLEDLIEAAIAALDELDGDCDHEDDGTAEPWLGWTRHSAIGNRLDLEVGAASDLATHWAMGGAHVRHS